MQDLSGQTLGQYRIIEPLGRGGMASVFKAYHPALDRDVAVKVLPPYYAQESGFIERFEREAKSVARLNHHHILPVYDCGQEGDYTYIVMQHVEGGTLRDLLTGQPMPLRATVRYIGEIASALDYAHRRGILHRDVKPANVLLDRSRNWWSLLGDFGLARMVEVTSALTGSGVGIGTPQYMSPEQGQGKKVDHHTDIYSLGVMLYQMTTGRIPFDAETPIAVIFKHVSEPLPMPSSINPDVPEGVERVIIKAMAKEPEDRFGSAGEMADVLRDAVSGLAVGESPIVYPPAEDTGETIGFETPPMATDAATELGGAPPQAARIIPTPVTPAPVVVAPRAGLPGWAWFAGGGGLLAVILLLVTTLAVGSVLRQTGKETPEPTTVTEELAKVMTVVTEEVEKVVTKEVEVVVTATSPPPTDTSTPEPTDTPPPTSTPTPIPTPTETPIPPTPTTDAEAYKERSEAYHEQGEYEKAIEELDKALQIDPNDAEAYKSRGDNYTWLGDYERAIEDYSKALQVDSDYAEAYKSRGSSYGRLGDYERAIEDFDKVLQIKPDDAATYYNRGDAYSKIGNLEKAMEDYNKVLQIDPDYAVAYVGRGYVYGESGNYEQCISDNNKALQLGLDRMAESSAYNNRGWCWKFLGDKEKARADWEKALQIYEEQGYKDWADQVRGWLAGL